MPHLFLHEKVADLFKVTKGKQTPVTPLTFGDLGRLVDPDRKFLNKQWSQLAWQLIKVGFVC